MVRESWTMVMQLLWRARTCGGDDGDPLWEDSHDLHSLFAQSVLG